MFGQYFVANFLVSLQIVYDLEPSDLSGILSFENISSYFSAVADVANLPVALSTDFVTIPSGLSNFCFTSLFS